MSLLFSYDTERAGFFLWVFVARGEGDWDTAAECYSCVPWGGSPCWLLISMDWVLDGPSGKD